MLAARQAEVPAVALPLAPANEERRWAAARLGVAIAGFCSFVGLYATQPLLPSIMELFGVGRATAALTVSAPTIAVAIASPFAGLFATRFGHRRVMILAVSLLAVPAFLSATANGIAALVAWRFLHGLVVPFAYVVALAYVAEEWPAEGLGRAMSALVTGNVIGGFSGRFLSGIVAQWGGWRASFLVLGTLTAIGAYAASRTLPSGGAGRRPQAVAGGFRLGVLLREPRLVATFAVGFNVLFTHVAVFTYVTYFLAGPPFRLAAGTIAWIFVVYLVGAGVTPVAGRWIDRVGSRRAVATAVTVAAAGALLMLVPALPAVGVGLAATCTAAFVSQAASTAFLRTAAPRDARSAASGLYVCCYYVGGAVGGVLPAAAWHLGGWAACVALVVSVQVVTFAITWRFWRTAGERA
jgi:YNFM family putative membrane transporter